MGGIFERNCKYLKWRPVNTAINSSLRYWGTLNIYLINLSKSKHFLQLCWTMYNIIINSGIIDTIKLILNAKKKFLCIPSYQILADFEKLYGSRHFFRVTLYRLSTVRYLLNTRPQNLFFIDWFNFHNDGTF